jgi:hypothetical protein
MEERSEYSVKRGRTHIAPALSVDDALQILQISVVNAIKAGVDIKVSPLYRANKSSVILVLENVALVENNLVAINGNSGPDVPAEVQDALDTPPTRRVRHEPGSDPVR